MANSENGPTFPCMDSPKMRAKIAEKKTPRHKHAFVGTDMEGDSCIYVMHIEKDGTTGPYFSTEMLQKIADRINHMRVFDEPKPSGCSRHPVDVPGCVDCERNLA